MTERRAGSDGADVSVEGLMQELLHSADADAPGDASLRNAARALGVPFAVLGAAAATSAKASAAVVGHVAAGHVAAGQLALGQAVSGAAASGAAASATAAATVSGAAVSGATVSGTAAGAGLGALGASGWSAGLALSVAKAVSVGVLVGGATIGTVKLVSQRGADPVRAAVTAARAARETPVSTAPGKMALGNNVALSAPPLSEAVVAEARNGDQEPIAIASASGARDRATIAAPTPVLSLERAELATAKPEPALVLAASSSVQSELDALSPARAALRAGDGALALVQLREYEARFPRGVLRTESEVLRIEARLTAEGRDAARAEAARFVARHPNSVHRSRLERLGLLSAPPAR